MNNIFLPTAYVPHFETDDELIEWRKDTQQLWADCVQEYFNPTYTSRTHFNHKTHQAGCRGPFCMAAMRAMGRKSQGSEPSEKFIYIDRLVQYFWETIALEDEESRIALQHNLKLMLMPNFAKGA